MEAAYVALKLEIAEDCKYTGLELRGGAEPPLPCKVVMPCGAEFDYPTLESFPKETLPCPCGKKDRYVVRYA